MMRAETVDQAAGMQAMDGTPLVLESVTMRGDVSGVRFDAHLVQRFRNPSESHVEVVYTFPLPWAAVLLGIEVEVGSRVLSGVVVERSRAEVAYEDAIADGDAAIMIERNDDESYTLNLGNLAPREICTVRIRYAQTLSFDATGLRLMIPTVVAPRYGDPVRQAGLRPHQVVEHDAGVCYPFSLSLRLGGEFARAKIASPSHLVTMQLEADGAVKVSLVREGALDRDFVLTLSDLVQPSLGLVAVDTVRADANAVLASFCPRLRRSGEAMDPVSVKLLVDCSGSMAGDSIAAARRALEAIIDGLGKGDRFALSRFGSRVYHRGRNMWRATDATRLTARKWIDALDADMGGTEMAAALAEVFAHGGDGKDQPIDVLMITDGHIHAVESTIAMARESGHRVFVVAIGASPSGHFLRRLAEETGGACDFVNAGEAVQSAIERMFARLRSPRRFGLGLRWPGEATPDWVSPVSPAIFDGDTVTVHAWVKGPLDGEVALVGRAQPGGALEVLGSAPLTCVPHDDALPRLVAAARVRQLDAEGTTPARAERLQLALDYQLVGEDTNFLLIHQRAADEKATDMPELIKVKSMIPAGYGGFGTEQLMCFEHRMEPLHMLLEPAQLDIRSARRFSRLFLEDAESSVSSLQEAVDERSPRDLLVMLDNTPIAAWPKSFEALRAMGLPEEVIVWIRTEAVPEDDEGTQVATFIDALCSATLWAQWGFRPDEHGSLRARVCDLTGRVVLTDTIHTMLMRATPDAWPEGKRTDSHA